MKEFQPGFRLSNLDIAVVVLGVIASIYLYSVSVLLSLIIVFVVSHFFLFCNIARMSRLPELIWAAIFVCLFVAAFQFNLLSVYLAFFISVCATVVLVYLEAKKPSYHGVFWERVNPNLPTWFADSNRKSI